MERLPLDVEFEHGAHGDEFVRPRWGVLWSYDGGREGESALGEGALEDAIDTFSRWRDACTLLLMIHSYGLVRLPTVEGKNSELNKLVRRRRVLREFEVGLPSSLPLLLLHPNVRPQGVARYTAKLPGPPGA